MKFTLKERKKERKKESSYIFITLGYSVSRFFLAAVLTKSPYFKTVVPDTKFLHHILCDVMYVFWSTKTTLLCVYLHCNCPLHPRFDNQAGI
jgi:hypothetical protein